MKLETTRLPRAVRAIFLGIFLATAATGITACGEEENEVGEELEEAGEAVGDSAEDAADAIEDRAEDAAD
jgi:hypothetical protein